MIPKEIPKRGSLSSLKTGDLVVISGASNLTVQFFRVLIRTAFGRFSRLISIEIT